jgi:RimJ/RimL family protein N-acetyltransferase
MDGADDAAMSRDGLPVLAQGAIRLEALSAVHRAELKAACEADQTIWDIYSIDLRGEGFERWFDSVTAVSAEPLGWKMWAVLLNGAVVGMTGMVPDLRHPGVAEVGTTFLEPGVRGSGLNRAVKWLVLGHLFASGIHRVEFRVDDRNSRSKAAVLKLGARHEGLLRRHKLTHTGFLRDTNIFALLDTEWPQIEPALRPGAP